MEKRGNKRMERMSTRKMYRKLAKKHKTTVGEVKKEMQDAIYYAYQISSKDISVKAMQDKIPSKGEIPNVEEVVRFAANQIITKNN